MKNTAILVALSLSVLACDSGSADGAQSELGDVALNDSTDATGKADALMGRMVRPFYTEQVQYGADTKRGVATVTEISDMSMTVESPMVELPAFEESLQVTVAGANDDTAIRFFLIHSSPDAGFQLITVEGEGDFEDGDEPDGGDSVRVPVEVSYFQSISIDAASNTISIATDDAGGQTTSDLGVDARTGTFLALALPVDSGWGNELLGEFGYTYDALCDGVECGEEPAEPDAPADDYAQARDVDAMAVTIGGSAIDYTRASVDGGFSLGGTEFWYNDENGARQKTFSYSQGSEAGRKCMLASAIRFEAIMSDPPAGMKELLENTNWGGSFFNWNEDMTGFDGAQLWAWKTGLIKWISGTAEDGTCYLPTRAMVERAADACLATGGDDGEIEGCRG